MSGVDEVISGSGSRATSGLSFYRVLIGESIKKYLFVDVSVNEQDQWQQVRLSVYPLNANSPLITCNVEELDSCYLNRNLLSSIHEVLVAVKCEDDCKYTLRLHWSDIEHLKIK